MVSFGLGLGLLLSVFLFSKEMAKTESGDKFFAIDQGYTLILFWEKEKLIISNVK